MRAGPFKYVFDATHTFPTIYHWVCDVYERAIVTYSSCFNSFGALATRSGFGARLRDSRDSCNYGHMIHSMCKQCTCAV